MQKLTLVTFILFALVSCKKDKTPIVDTGDNEPVNQTYQPTSVGSEWNYQLLVSGVPSATYKTIRLDKDSLINGTTYQVFDSEQDGLQFIRHNGAQYYNILTSSSNLTELKLLDTTKAINETWVGGTNGSDTYEYTIVAKHATYTIEGYDYKNVIQVKQERKDGSNNITLSSDNYYALGIGQIYSKGTINNIPLELELRSVTIK